MRESKFVVLGAGGVGKTSLVIRFLDNVFTSTYKPTVEDCYQHTIQLPGKSSIMNNYFKKFLVWFTCFEIFFINSITFY